MLLLDTPSGTAWGSHRVAESQLRRVLEGPDELTWRHADRPVKISHESLIVQAEIPLRQGSVRVAYKRYRPRNWWKALLWLLGRARAFREWELAAALMARDIATAEPILACRPAGWRRATSYLATEWIEGAENLHLFLGRLAARPAPERLRSAALAAVSLGRLVGRMHAAGIAHRDLKAANLLVVQRPEGVKTYLVDLAGAKLVRRLGSARRAADLARLAVGLAAHPWVPRTASCRFLRAYATEFPGERLAWKPLWRAVAGRSRRLALRKQSRGQDVL
ncbi:MAG: lipopolysaccharide kinase InaA family protein [Thermoguttaceae bacterium]